MHADAKYEIAALCGAHNLLPDVHTIFPASGNQVESARLHPSNLIRRTGDGHASGISEMRCELQEDVEIVGRSRGQSSLAPHGRTMAFVCQVGRRGRAISSSTSGTQNDFKATH